MAAPSVILSREEYVEQAYFFRVLRERIENGTPIQEILVGVREEILATTKLPMAIDFLLGELQFKGRFGEGMNRLLHYFTPFQAFVFQKAEDDRSKLDFQIAVRILEREAEFRSGSKVSPAALFIYQFECITRNRLGYEQGMVAIAGDPLFAGNWKTWINKVQFDLGTVDFASLVYQQSQLFLDEIRQRRREPDYASDHLPLFDSQAGRIARANQNKDPLYFFAALQRQLGYPVVPRPKAESNVNPFSPQAESRFQRLEARIALLEQEQRNGLDLSQFYKSPDSDEGDSSAG
ncbi:hypothetical protein SH668x_000782 [Planctomicrobium sp. SH668]|uniref:hypothetical protein n=1 Tax=Planctomicrobium sp. SH668 TaxID=3448126 RepID=UPI003F5B3F99